MSDHVPMPVLWEARIKDLCLKVAASKHFGDDLYQLVHMLVMSPEYEDGFYECLDLTDARIFNPAYGKFIGFEASTGAMLWGDEIVAELASVKGSDPAMKAKLLELAEAFKSAAGRE